MGTVLTEKKHDFGFLMTEANGHRSRDRGVLASGQNLRGGTVLKTDGDKFSAFDGTGTAVAVLGSHTDASAADAPCVVIARDAEVNIHELTFAVVSPPIEAESVRDDLAAVGIILR
jgi:hypothetical protein